MTQTKLEYSMRCVSQLGLRFPSWFDPDAAAAAAGGLGAHNRRAYTRLLIRCLSTISTERTAGKVGHYSAQLCLFSPFSSERTQIFRSRPPRTGGLLAYD